MSTPSDFPPPPGHPGQPGQPTEEEIRAAYEAEIKRLRVEDVVVQTLISLINLGGRKAGLAPGTEDERDPQQLKIAIDAADALLPLVEQQLGPDAGQIRTAISQLQMTYAQLVSRGEGGDAAGEGDQPRQQPPQQPGGGSGLWVPGQ